MASDDDRAAPRIALGLDAGGARSAYQVGVLEALLPALDERGQRPDIIVGTSAGALLAAAVASTAHLPVHEQTVALRSVLFEVTKKNVIRALWKQVPNVVVRYVSETLGMSRLQLRGLFSTAPLTQTLTRVLDWDALHRNIDSGTIQTLAVTATAVRTGRVTVFTETSVGGDLPEAPDEHHRIYERTRLQVEHLMASAAIPVLFPSVEIHEPARAAGWYVDGATRRRHPFAPPIELGADRVCMIGTGSLNPTRSDDVKDQVPVDIADGVAALLGAVMEDPLRYDVSQLVRQNQWAADPELKDPIDRHREQDGRPPMRVVPHIAIAPDRGHEIAAIAMEVFRGNHRGPAATALDPDLQIIYRLLGSNSPLQGEMMSYLMFDVDFFTEVADLGRRDGEAWLADHPDLWVTGVE